MHSTMKMTKKCLDMTVEELRKVVEVTAIKKCLNRTGIKLANRGIEGAQSKRN